MVKPRKTGLKAPPRVHAGESVPEVAELDAPDGDAGAAVEGPSVDGRVDDEEVATAVGAASRVDGVEVDVASAGDSLLEETGSEIDLVAAAGVEALAEATAEPAEAPAPADAVAVAVEEADASSEPGGDVLPEEPAVTAEEVDTSSESGGDVPDEPVDPVEAALAAASAPRAAPPGVVLSDELPIDPDDDLRGVEGEASARLVSILESLLFSAAKPLSVKDLRKVLQETSQRQIQLALRHLLEVTRTRGVVLAQVAGGFQFRTHPDNAVWVQKMLQAKPAKLSRTQIETLAIVAYRQPVTRPEIDDIRGVDSGAVLKSLLERELIQIVGKKDEPGRPLLYGTTVRFLEFFNLRNLRDLPTLRDFRDLSDESKATLRDRLGDLQFAEAMGQEVLGLAGADAQVGGDMSPETGNAEPAETGDADGDPDARADAAAAAEARDGSAPPEAEATPASGETGESNERASGPGDGGEVAEESALSAGDATDSSDGGSAPTVDLADDESRGDTNAAEFADTARRGDEDGIAVEPEPAVDDGIDVQELSAGRGESAASDPIEATDTADGQGPGDAGAPDDGEPGEAADGPASAPDTHEIEPRGGTEEQT